MGSLVFDIGVHFCKAQLVGIEAVQAKNCLGCGVYGGIFSVGNKTSHGISLNYLTSSFDHELVTLRTSERQKFEDENVSRKLDLTSILRLHLGSHHPRYWNQSLPLACRIFTKVHITNMVQELVINMKFDFSKYTTASRFEQE